MSNAESYAQSIADDISRMDAAGAPFGLRDRETDEWDNSEEAYLDWQENDETNWEEASPLDYLSDVLDIEYRVGSDGEYRSALVMIAMGGPNAWIDTKTSELIVAWWSKPVRKPLPAAFIDGIDEALEELWSMAR
jgi:hypothetical protein